MFATEKRFLVIGRACDPKGVAGGYEIIDLCDSWNEAVRLRQKLESHERLTKDFPPVSDIRILEVVERI